MQQHLWILKTPTPESQTIMIIKANLEQFDFMPLSYRAEITYNNIMYKLWKEYGFSRRLEIWKPGEYTPEFYISMERWEELLPRLPLPLHKSEDWKIFILYPGG